MTTALEFQEMMDKLPCGIGLYEDSAECNEIYLNDAFFELIGCTRAAYSGMTRHPMEFYIAPEDWPICKDNIIKMQKQGFIRNSEYRIIRPDKTLRWIQLNVSKINLDGRMLNFASFTDITKVKEQAAIQEGLMNAIPGSVAIFKVSNPMKCLYYNETIQSLGFSPKKKNHLSVDLTDPDENIVAPIDRERFIREVSEKASQGLPINITYRYMKTDEKQDGHFEWVHLTARKIREDDGCPVYYAVMTVPPQENLLYRSIVEDSMTAALVTEASTGTVLFANQAFSLMIGSNEKDGIVGKPIGGILPPATATALLSQAEHLSADKLVENVLHTMSGKTLLVKSKKLFWNGLDACLFYMLDQTALQKRNSDLMKLLDDIPGGIGINELRNGHMTQMYLNDGFFRILGASRKTMSGFTEERHKNAVHPDDIRLFADAVSKLNKGENKIDVTYRIKNCKNQYIWLRMIGNVNRHEDGKIFVYCSYFDVDQQMKTQLSLDQERTTLELAMQAANLGSWEYDVASKTLRQGFASQKQDGYGAVLENVPDSLIADGYVHPYSADVYRDLFRPLTKKCSVIQADAYVRSTDRSGYWWERSIMTPVFDRYGKHVRSIGVSFDVTEQKTLEAKFKQQVMAFNSANTTNLMAKGLYNLSNNTVENYHEETINAIKLDAIHSYDDGMNATAHLFIDQNEAARFRGQFDREHLLQQFKSGNVETVCEYQRRTVNGGIIWAQTTGKLYYDPSTGNVMCFIYSYDIDDKKTIQEIIDAVVKVDYDYMALLDCRTNMYSIYANQDNTKTPLPPFHSSDYRHEVEEYAKAYLIPADVDRNIREMSLDNIRRQLTNQDSYVTYASIRENDGSISRKKLQFSYFDRAREKVLITRVDITDVYEREQEQIRRLQEASNAKNSFLSHMSHDLRTPMNTIIGLSELAEDELSDPDAIKTYVDNIKSAGQFLLGLVNDCLDFEKLTAHKMNLHPVPYPYAEFRNSITMMIAPLCQKKQIDFSFSESAPYTVYIDKVRFEQIFFNLLSNAVKYTPRGGKIDFIADSHLNEDGSLIVCDFYVRDNGIGMSEEFQKKLFEPFEQESSDETLSGKGTGLGLSIVKELVDLMGGTISFFSRQNKGTEVTVHLDMPNAESLALFPPKKRSGSGKQLIGKNLLLIEDQQMNMLIASKLLKKRGITVACAENGKLGLDLFVQSQEGFFDAVLTDIRMPVMNGLETARAIRALDRSDAKTVPIIAMTANAFEEDVRATKESGMNAHLSKPIDPELLFYTLEQCILEH